MKTGNAILRRPNRKKDQVISDLITRIRGEELRCGERMPSMIDLRKSYGVSQRVVTAALKQLVADRWLYQPNRGCYYIRDRLPDLRKPVSRDGSRIEEGEMVRDETWDGNIIVSSADSRTLTIFINDGYESAVNFWEDAITGFKAYRPEITIKPIFQRENLANDFFRKNSIDIAQLSQTDLNNIGSDRFIDLSWDVFGVDKGEMISPVKKAIERGGVIIGVPFSMSIHYVYINKDLQKQLELKTPKNFDSLLNQLAEIKSRDEGVKLLSMPSAPMLLLIAGALSRDCANVDLNIDCLQKLLPRIKTLTDSLVMHDERAGFDIDKPKKFISGNVLYLFCHSYYAIRLNEMPPGFDWAVHPTPINVNGAQESVLTSLAVNRDTSTLNEAIEFIKYICSTEMQIKYGLLGGNLPVSEAAFETGRLDHAFPLPIAKLKRLLEQNILFIWPPNDVGKKMAKDLDYCTSLYWHDEMELDECIGRIKVLFDFYADRTRKAFEGRES